MTTFAIFLQFSNKESVFLLDYKIDTSILPIKIKKLRNRGSQLPFQWYIFSGKYLITPTRRNTTK